MGRRRGRGLLRRRIIVDDLSKKERDSLNSKGFCELSASANCRYGWVDTCCINKGNSTELSDAINSMYQWYRDSKICIVYLEDVPQT